VLGNLLGLAGFEYVNPEEVRDELRHELDSYRGGVATAALFAPGRLAAVDATRDVGLYGVDPIVRRSAPLQATADGRAGQGGAA
jgi:NADH-quinone oxidoreductase subunit G